MSKSICIESYVDRESLIDSIFNSTNNNEEMIEFILDIDNYMADSEFTGELISKLKTRVASSTDDYSKSFEIDRNLESFLLEKGILNEFIEETNAYRKGGEFSDHSIIDNITSAFIFSESEKGTNYWLALSTEYQKVKSKLRT